MPIPSPRQPVLYLVPFNGAAAESAATAAQRTRAAYAIRDARHRRCGQAALAASVLKLSGRRR